MSGGRVRANLLLEEAAKEAREEIVATLQDIGLTGPAAKVFFALTRVSEATAGDLVLTTGIPDSKIYYALRELVEAGLLEVQEGKPRTYRTVSPQEAENRLQKILSARHERERGKVRRMGSLIEPLQAGSRSPTMDLAYVVKGMSNVLTRANLMISSARRGIVVLASEESFFRSLEEDLADAARRGVQVRLAVPEVEVAEDLKRLAEIRPIVCSCLVLVVDEQQILTVTETPDGSGYAITSTDETLVRLGLDYWDSPRCCIVGE